MLVQPPTAEAISHYLVEARRRYAANTVEHRRPLLLRLARAHNGDLLGLTGPDIDLWLDRAHVVTKTRNAYIGSFSSFYRFCVRTGVLAHSPCDDLIRTRAPRSLPRPIRPADLTLALEHAKPRMRAWLCLMAYGGFRCCEVSGLHVDDLLWHMDPPTMHIRRHGPVGGPKGGHERLVPMARVVEDALVAHGLPRAGPIFRKPGTADATTPAQVSKVTAMYLDDLGIRATAHQLRHLFGTTLYAETLDLRATQEMMGHRSPDTTAIYVQWARSEATAVIRGFGVTVDA